MQLYPPKRPVTMYNAAGPHMLEDFSQELLIL